MAWTKAREIAEKAESENRAMTAEEQKSYDEIMTEGRAVADAVKRHRHDQSVWAFARELSDNVIGGLGGGDFVLVGFGEQVAPTFLQGPGPQSRHPDARTGRTEGIGLQWRYRCRRQTT